MTCNTVSRLVALAVLLGGIAVSAAARAEQGRGAPGVGVSPQAPTTRGTAADDDDDAPDSDDAQVPSNVAPPVAPPVNGAPPSRGAPLPAPAPPVSAPGATAYPQMPYISAGTPPPYFYPPEPPPKPDAFETCRIALEGHVGMATPVGSLGFMLEYSLAPAIGLAGGAGTGSDYQGNSFRGALGLRFRPVRGKENALVIGTAYSFGAYRRFDLGLGEIFDTGTVGARWAHWAQADIGWERRSVSGFLLRLALGAAWLLDPSDLTCSGGTTASGCGIPNSESLATFDITLGYAL